MDKINWRAEGKRELNILVNFSKEEKGKNENTRKRSKMGI